MYTLVKSVEFYYTLPSTLVWSYHSSTEVWSLSIKVWSFFIPHSVCTITKHFLCHYKLSHCLPTCLSYSPFECLSACRSDCLCHCLWSFPLVACLCVFLFVCLSVVFLPVYPSACPYACLFVPLHVYLPLSVCPSLLLPVCLSVCLPVRFPACMAAVCPFACVSVLLSRSMIKSSCVDSYVVFSHELFHYFVRTENWIPCMLL